MLKLLGTKRSEYLIFFQVRLASVTSSVSLVVERYKSLQLIVVALRGFVELKVIV